MPEGGLGGLGTGVGGVLSFVLILLFGLSLFFSLFFLSYFSFFRNTV